MTDICDHTATQLKEKVESKEVSCEEVVLGSIRRYESVNPSINAIVITNFEKALDDARRLDRSLARRNLADFEIPLPIAIKDLNDVNGLLTTFGSPLFKSNMCNQDDDVVANLRRNSLIMLGKSNVPEHGFGATTTNPLFGSTGNPFNPKLSAGASTGGGAAAVCAGITTLATGSDFAGSLRTPASFCGISGVRPSNGVVGTARRTNIWSPFDVEGPMGKTAEDCKLLLKSMAQKHKDDPFSITPDDSLFKPAEEIDLQKLSVAYSEDLGFAPVSTLCRETFRRKFKEFSGLFRSVVPDHVDFSLATETFMTLRGVGFVGDFGKMEEEFGSALGSVVIEELKKARKLSAESIARAFMQHSEIYKQSSLFFKKYDLLITPAAAVTPFPHEAIYPEKIDDCLMAGYLDWESIAWAITLTQCPAVVIPCGLDNNGMPFGIQIVGKRHHDGFLLDAAHSLELALNKSEVTSRPIPDFNNLSLTS